MNIEHEHLARVGQYKPFEGICLVDTFSTVGQTNIFSAENTKRIRRQMDCPIRVVIGNPPYNAGQTRENDQNKNRKYKQMNSIDERVRKTYAKDSRATLRNKLGDSYIKAIRWATDRIEDHGIVCLVTNNSFINRNSLDGVRKHLAHDYSLIYVVDLGGSVELNPKLSGTTHNVFGIQLGVAVTFLVKHLGNDTQAEAKIHYARMPEYWRRTEKLDQLEKWNGLTQIPWKILKPDPNWTWLTEGKRADYASFNALASSSTKSKALFAQYSLGVSTNRDSVAYDSDRTALLAKVRQFIEAYDSEVDRYVKCGKPENLDEFVNYDLLKWSRNLKRHLENTDRIVIDEELAVTCIYRPFTARFLYLSDVIVDEPARTGSFVGQTNKVICVTAPAASKPFSAIATNRVVDSHLSSPGCGTQCFPFFTFNEGDPQENITDWALAEFRGHYVDNSISKWDIFHSIYAVLHHPGYRTRYVVNLNQELPRIPFPPDFPAFVSAGERLMELHIDYERQPEYKLEQVEDTKAEVTFRVERMKLSKDKTELRYNDFLTLRGIPAAVFDYRLGNRSALEWIIDQYRVSYDPHSGIVNDPNRKDDPKYILRLIGQIITVSLETQEIIAGLPGFSFDQATSHSATVT